MRRYRQILRQLAALGQGEQPARRSHQADGDAIIQIPIAQCIITCWFCLPSTVQFHHHSVSCGRPSLVLPGCRLPSSTARDSMQHLHVAARDHILCHCEPTAWQTAELEHRHRLPAAFVPPACNLCALHPPPQAVAVPTGGTTNDPTNPSNEVILSTDLVAKTAPEPCSGLSDCRPFGKICNSDRHCACPHCEPARQKGVPGS